MSALRDFASVPYRSANGLSTMCDNPQFHFSAFGSETSTLTGVQQPCYRPVAGIDLSRFFGQFGPDTEMFSV